jgi:hypothetical protein
MAGLGIEIFKITQVIPEWRDRRPHHPAEDLVDADT